MKPEKIMFYVYAESTEEVEALQKELYKFVNNKYEKGVLITANRLTMALRSFGNSPILNSYFNGK